MRQWTIDAFASGPFKGNQACVVDPFDAWPDSGWMQALAAENNQAETAFLLRTAEPGRFGLRWMTPAVEVPLCGHATLASAHVLFEEMAVQSDSLTFDTQSGPLGVRRAGERLEMDFPSNPPSRADEPAGLAAALGVKPVEVWAAQYLVAILADEDQVRTLTPDIAALRPISSEATRGPGNVGIAALAASGLGLRCGRPVLRARLRHSRRSGDRIAALHPGAAVRRAAGQTPDPLPPGLSRPRRRHRDRDGGRTRPAARSGGDRHGKPAQTLGAAIRWARRHAASPSDRSLAYQRHQW